MDPPRNFDIQEKDEDKNISLEELNETDGQVSTENLPEDSKVRFFFLIVRCRKSVVTLIIWRKMISQPKLLLLIFLLIS
jgi:hypothetical protein